MHTVSLENQLLQEMDGMRVAFPVSAATGSAASAAVYFELDPGAGVGMHTDSAEEVVVVLEGEAEAIVGDEIGRLVAGDVAVIPASVPHDVRNVGEGPVRVLGFFAGSAVVHVFEQPLGPEGERLFVTGAEAPLAVAL